MSKIPEQKRVGFVSSDLSTTGTSAAAASARFGNDFLVPPNKPLGSGEAKCEETIVLELELFPTDSNSYPEFNYAKLLQLEKKKLKKLKEKSNGMEVDGQNDNDIARIAKDLEKKYGTAYGRARGSSNKDDHCDIGLGYDESDSFIDNTDAYDEVIPEEVETIEGGFYINCGALEFKKLHVESTTTKTDEIIKMPNRPKKRTLSSSSSSEGDSTDTDENDDSDKNNNDLAREANEALDEPKKVKNAAGTPVEKRLKNLTISKPKAQENGKSKGSAIMSDKINSNPCSSSNSPKPYMETECGGSESEKERVRQQKPIVVKTTTVKDMLKAKRDNFLKMQVGGNEVKSVNGELRGATAKSSDDDSSSEDSDDSSNSDDSNLSSSVVESIVNKKSSPSTNMASTAPAITAAEENPEKLRSVDTKLPVLDADVLTSIVAFEETVRTRCITGKKFQFDDELTEHFLQIDDSLLCIDKPQRNMVFAHLEYQLLLPKYYFLRKAKQLRIKEEKLKSKRALGKLRKAVIESMPEAIQRYELELQKYTAANENVSERKKLPKKKFTWTTLLRNLLYDVYQVRWTSFLVLGTRKETLEEFITGYMRKKVVDLWPTGWMRYEELQREIDKRKAAAKKAKEKKKAETTSTLTTTTTANVVLPSISAAVVANAYMKQFEELNANSNRSCETETNIKRKCNDNIKQNSKSSKTQKSNGEQQQQSSAANSTVPVALLSPSKRTDHSIHSIIALSACQTATSPASLITSTVSVAAPSHGQLRTSSLTQQQQLQQQQKHSTSLNNEPTLAVPMTKVAHVIDLDNYKCTSDILQTSKQLIAAQSNANKHDQQMSWRRDSSSESDGVEIVGFFPSKPSTKQKNKKSSTTNAKLNNLDSMHDWKQLAHQKITMSPPPKDLSKQ